MNVYPIASYGRWARHAFLAAGPLMVSGTGLIFVGSQKSRKRHEEFDMGEFTDKVSAAANKVSGKIKEEVGKATGNEKLEVEGDAQQLKGKAQDVKGSVKGALGDKI